MRPKRIWSSSVRRRTWRAPKLTRSVVSDVDEKESLIVITLDQKLVK